MLYSNLVLSVVDGDLYYPKESNKYSVLFKSCNTTWKDNPMNTEGSTLCNEWNGGSLITSLSMSLYQYGYKWNNNDITPDILNQFMLSQNAYGNDNIINDPNVLSSISNTISFIGSYNSININDLKHYINEGYVIIAMAKRILTNNAYYNDISRYINIIGYSTTDNDVIIARDALLNQQRFSFENDISGDYWIWNFV